MFCESLGTYIKHFGTVFKSMETSWFEYFRLLVYIWWLLYSLEIRCCWLTYSFLLILFWVYVNDLYKLISCWLILITRWLFIIASADSRSTLCRFQLTLRYNSISKNARWDFLKNRWRVWFFLRGISKPLNFPRPHPVWRSVFVVCLLWRFWATTLRHVHCLFVWVFVTIYGNNW